ncbi:unnamed protein product [Paramecium pentaurelia]|uniref:Uncharacterized protein n=1 Tax=Paramecium pentaurelia TaxID=43138 RepID=A0A8S1X643_9CILI|nr:unnamed protein product [Paramecium pentaurelia]
MVRVSFIKILFMHPFLLYEGCVQNPGADCINIGWTNGNRIVECAGKYYVGDFTGGQKVSQIFPCPPERKLILSFTIAKFDSWDQESVFIYVDNELIGKITYSPFEGSQICLNSFYPDLMEKKSYQFVSPIGQNSFKLLFDDNLQSFDIESWGFRDIRLQILNPCVDFYSECNFLGDMWRICAGNQTLFVKFVPFKIKSINILQGISVQMKDSRYNGGTLQTYNSNQTCLDDFNVIYYHKPFFLVSKILKIILNMIILNIQLIFNQYRKYS